MSELRYDIYFRGESLNQQDVVSLKRQFARLFKLDGAKTEHFFSGKVVALRKNIDRASAIKFKQTLETIGAKVYVKQAENTQAQPAAEVAKATADAKQFEVLPVGSDVLKENERSPHQAKEIDLSHLQLSSAATLNDSKSINTPPAPDVSHITTAEVGADVLEGYYTETLPLPQPDISHLSLAQANSVLLESKSVEKAQTPDVSHIRLEE